MFKQTIIENQAKIKEIKLIKRDISFDFDILKLNKIVSFVWPRRAWKTFFMYQLIQEMIKKSFVKLEQIVFLDFVEFNKKDFDFDLLLENFYELFPNLEPIFIFDEVQEINNFRAWILKLFNKWFKIFITWSNSNLLSSELSTHFSWRNIEYMIYPLSFTDFCKFNNFEIAKNMTINQKWALKNLFSTYLDYWAFPELALTNNENLKKSILQNYFDIIIYKDLKERYKIENEYVMKYLTKKMILSDTKDININKIFNELKSQNVEVSKNTLYNYLEYLINIFFIEKLYNFYTPTWTTKVFLIDWGFLNIYNENDLWKKLENLVFIILKNKYKNIHFLRGKKEIDFFVESENHFLQVVYNLNLENSKRELSPFESINWKKTVIYYENNLTDEDMKRYNDIEYINIFDFLSK